MHPYLAQRLHAAHTADLLREARRGQLAAQLLPQPALRHRLAARFGLLLIRAGRRLTRSAYAAHVRQMRGPWASALGEGSCR